MTLDDHETGREIVNPYITLYSPERAWVALNTETFRPAQNGIINLHDDKTYIKYAIEENRRLYQVVATIGKQDHPFDYETRDHWTRGVRVKGADDAMALVPLGHILEDVVKGLFPKAFEHFESVRRKKE
jgi:hypothetical protein